MPAKYMPKYMPAFLAAILACGMCVRADSGPQPPCAGPPFPPVPDVDAAPVVKVWERADWTPAACTGWTASAGATVVATAARFRYNGEAPGLRRRIGAISALAGMLYWSTTNQRWQPLIVDAYALSGPSDDQRRQDFSPDEIVEGRILYVHQEDNLVGKAIYRIRIVTATAARLVFATENSSTIRYMSIPVFPPG